MIFGPKRDDQTSEWRRLHNGELHDLTTKSGVVGRSQNLESLATDTRTFILGYVCNVICPEAGLSLDIHYQGSAYLSLLDKREE